MINPAIRRTHPGSGPGGSLLAAVKLNRDQASAQLALGRLRQAGRAACLGGWAAPFAFGLVKDATGSDTIWLLAPALAALPAAAGVILAGHDRRMERIPPHR
jgi:hypothetical protein